MPSLADMDLELADREEILAAFQNISRQMFYMALFDNETRALDLFNEGTGGDEEITGSPLHAFSRYLFQNMSGNFPLPEELTLEEWVELAEEIRQKLAPEVDVPALAQKIYSLLKQEIKTERERQIRLKSW
jgi:hypothetical protein